VTSKLLREKCCNPDCPGEEQRILVKRSLHRAVLQMGNSIPVRNDIAEVEYKLECAVCGKRWELTKAGR
jgi:hypothetical protein